MGPDSEPKYGLESAKSRIDSIIGMVKLILVRYLKLDYNFALLCKVVYKHWYYKL
jgi:hypothetical protein